MSFHTLIALVHLLHGNPYSLTLISIDGHLHGSLICLVDVRPSSSFLSSPQPPFYSTYSAMSMAHAHVLCESWKGLRILKYETIAWLKPGLCMIWIFCVTKMEHSQTIWFCRDELSLAMLFWEDMITLLVCLKYFFYDYQAIFNQSWQEWMDISR